MSRRCLLRPRPWFGPSKAGRSFRTCVPVSTCWTRLPDSLNRIVDGRSVWLFKSNARSLRTSLAGHGPAAARQERECRVKLIASARRLLILGAVALLLPLPACSFVYRAEAIEGWVVDSETGKPIEGVILVAHWLLKGGFEGGNPIKELQVLEAVTDSNGRYYFPAWGPKFALSGNLKSESPEILVFSPGYKALGLSNQWYEGRDSSKFDFNKKTTKLVRFKGAPSEYAKDLDRLSDSLFRVGSRYDKLCIWRSFPKMLVALDRQESKFRHAGTANAMLVSQLRVLESQLKAAGCSVNDFLTKQ